jgi:tripartite-type tricarboxylate transporter receptor subunit TctC
MICIVRVGPWFFFAYGLTVLIFVAAALISAPAAAQDYPQRPIRLLQGFPPGGNADIVARILGQEMAKTLGQPIVVEARPGAGGNIAADAVARAAPDGYTLLLVTGGHAVAGAAYKSLPYQTVESFEMISTATFFPFVVAVRAEAAAPQTFGELLARARVRPEAVSYGAAGPGVTQHLTGELLASMAGVKLLYVPYKGDAGAVTGLLGGEMNFIIAPATAVLPHAKSGKFRVLAATGPNRWPGLPDVPTVAEAGVAGFDVRSWIGLATTAGTPRPIVQRLNAEMQRALAVPEVRARLEDIGGEVRGGTSEEMRALVASDLARWKRVIAASAIQPQ